MSEFERVKSALEKDGCVCSAKHGVEMNRHEGCAVCPKREDAVDRVSGKKLFRDEHPGDTDEPLIDEKSNGVLEEE